MRALLDVNVLLALLDADQVDQPRYPSPIPPGQAIDPLARATGTGHHEFWSCAASILDEQVVDRSRLHGSKQVTDAYLLALAVQNGGRFVTFERSVVLGAVPAARDDHLVVL